MWRRNKYPEEFRRNAHSAGLGRRPSNPGRGPRARGNPRDPAQFSSESNRTRWKLRSRRFRRGPPKVRVAPTSGSHHQDGPSKFASLAAVEGGVPCRARGSGRGGPDC